VNLRAAREGIRVGWHSIRARLSGPTRYDGDATEICERIVAACWDASLDIFITSLHNYPLFYARDFGMCVDALLALGHRDRVRKTLAWALDRYEENGRITLILNRRGKGFNFPDMECPDGYAFLLHSLVALGDKTLLKKHKAFLEQELERFTEKVVDGRTGLMKRGLRVGGMRDHAIRDSSCYDNAMLAAVRKYSKILKLKNPLAEFDYERLLIDNFWTGSYFKDDMASDALTGDTNVLPFWFRVFTEKKEKELWKQALAAMRKERLDEPVPLRYEAGREGTRMILLDTLAMGGWERDTVWLHLGNLFVQAVARYDKGLARKYLERFRELIARERNYPEVLTKEGKPHTGPFFHADDSMLWACNFLALEKALGTERRIGTKKRNGEA